MPPALSDEPQAPTQCLLGPVWILQLVFSTLVAFITLRCLWFAQSHALLQVVVW